MTLANMREQGVRSLWVVCDLCHHEAVFNVDRYGDAVPVPAFGPRMVCTRCLPLGAILTGISREANACSRHFGLDLGGGEQAQRKPT
jgi:hypothetical protein